VHSTTIVMDMLTGHIRGFAYVRMPDAAEAAAAIQHINDSIIDGRKIRAEEAVTLEQGGRADAGRYHPCQ
jgi:RNA recognition motif-containing protein